MIEWLGIAGMVYFGIFPMAYYLANGRSVWDKPLWAYRWLAFIPEAEARND